MTLQTFRPLLALILLCCTIAAQAQTFHISEPYSTRNHIGYEILGKVGENYLLFRDKGTEFDVMAFNGGMVNTWSRELDVPTRGTKVLSVIGADNDFSIFYKTRQKGTGDYLLGIRKFDPSTTLIDSLTIKNYGPNYQNQPILETVMSENRQMVAFMNGANEDRIDIICFQVDKMQVLWEKSWFKDDKEDRADRAIPGFLLTNDGTLLLTSDQNNKRSRKNDEKEPPHKMRIVAITAAGDDLFTIPMQEQLTSDLAWAYDPQNRQVVCAGIWSEKNPEKAQGHFLMRFDLGTKQPEVVYTPFDEQMTGVVAGKDTEDASKGIPHLRARKLLLRRDGGVVFVCERNHFIERGITTSRSALFRDAPRRIIDYFYDDLVLLTTHPDGKSHWRTVLHKKQYSQDDEGIYSSFFAMLGTNQLRLFFNDEIQHESTCSAYVVAPTGTYSRESILNTEDKRLKLRFRDAVQVNGNEVIIPSEYNSKLQLVRMEY